MFRTHQTCEFCILLSKPFKALAKNQKAFSNKKKKHIELGYMSPWQEGSTHQVNNIWPNGWLHKLENKEYYLVSWSPVGGSTVYLVPKPLNIDTCMNQFVNGQTSRYMQYAS